MTSPKHATSTQRGRQYINPTTGDACYSVTTILGQIGKAEALKWWAAAETAKYAVTMKDTWLNLEDQAAIDLLKREPLRVLNKAASRGTDVHAIADHYAQTGTIGDIAQHSGYVDAMRSFFADHQPLPILAEQTVFSSYGYAGSFDLVCRLPALGDAVCILDYKTSKAIYPDTAAQLAAYANAEQYINENDKMMPMPNIDVGVVVRFGEDGSYEVQQADLVAGWAMFKAALAVFKAQENKMLLGRVHNTVQHGNQPMRDNIIERVQWLQNNHPNDLVDLLEDWIVGLPPLGSDEPIHRHQLAILDRVVSVTEMRLQTAPFNPPPQPEPPAMFQKTTPPPATLAGDELPCSTEQIDQMRTMISKAPAEVKKAIQATTQEASQAKTTLSLNGKPTLRRAVIAQLMYDIYTYDNSNNREYMRTLLRHHMIYQTDIGTSLGATDLDKISLIGETHTAVEQGDLNLSYDPNADQFSITKESKQK